LGEPRLQLENAARGPAVVQREPVVGLEQVAADDASPTEVVKVERLRHGAIVARGGAGPRPSRRRPDTGSQTRRSSTPTYDDPPSPITRVSSQPVPSASPESPLGDASR